MVSLAVIVAYAVGAELVENVRTRFTVDGVGPHRLSAAAEIASGLALATVWFLAL